MADFLTRRGNRYYFQRAVPRKLQPRIGKKLWRSSLGDCSYRDAQRRARPLIDETDAIISGVECLTPERLSAISDELQALGVDMAADTLVSQKVAQRLSEARDEAIRSLCKSVLIASKPLQGVLSLNDIVKVLASGSPSAPIKEHAAACVATITASKEIPMELRGEPKKKVSQTAQLEELHGRWAARSKVTPQTAAEALTTVRRFTELHGPLAAEKITRDHCREFRAAMLKMPRTLTAEMRQSDLPDILRKLEGQPYELVAPVTARKRLTFLKSVLAFGVEEGDLEESPAAGLAIKAGTESDGRKPFSAGELEAIFGTLEARSERDAFYWISVLLLATGARAGEIIPIEGRDIIRIGETYALKVISDPESGRRLKTKHSERTIPLHLHVINLGFPDFVPKDDGRLFPEYQLSKNGKFSALFSQRWNRWLRQEVGIKDSSKSLHSLRHSFKSLARHAGIPEDIHDAITGHRPASVGRGYGDYPTSILGTELSKISLPFAKS